jgi:hypothetical protein
MQGGAATLPHPIPFKLNSWVLSWTCELYNRKFEFCWSIGHLTLPKKLSDIGIRSLISIIDALYLFTSIELACPSCDT